MRIVALMLLSSALACRAQQNSLPPNIPSAPRIPIDSSAQVTSETYLGMLACSDCSGTRAEITLYWEGRDGRTPIAYHMTETAVGAQDRAPVEDAGFFTEKAETDPAELTGAPVEGTLVQLTSGGKSGSAFLRVAGNNGELLLLNAQMRVLPDTVPHSLGRVTGEQQHGLTLLTERDDGHTIQLKGGEVFLVVLPLPGDERVWGCDRPSAMVLLEPESEQAIANAAGNSQPAQPVVAQVKLRPGIRAVQPRRRIEPPLPTYQAWQMVAPPEETTPVERDLVFRLHKPVDKNGLPSKIVTLHIQVP